MHNMLSRRTQGHAKDCFDITCRQFLETNQSLHAGKLWGKCYKGSLFHYWQAENGVNHHHDRDHDQVGKLLMASGGRRQGRALRSVEAMLPDGGKGER